jgi:competence protein ComEC
VRLGALLGALTLLVGYARAEGAVERSERALHAIRDVGAWPALCRVEGRVATSPALLGGGFRIDLGSVEARCRDGPSALPTRLGRVALYVPRDVSVMLARDDQVLATASLAPPYRFWNDGTGDPRPRSARRGVLLSGSTLDIVVVRKGWGLRAAIDRVRAHLRTRILLSFPGETSPMARALVLGEDDLSEDDQRAFRNSGLAHLLAVSGMHLVLVVMGAVAVLRAVLARTSLAASFDVARLAAVAGLFVAWVYADLAGGSGSALRAAWMCSVVLLARALGRRASVWRALGLSLVGMAALDPLVVFDVSFVLSALATIGIVTVAPPIEAAVSRWSPRVPAFLLKPLAATTAATVFCAPVLATMAPQLPIGGLLANVIAAPLGEAVALPLCLLHALASPWPAAEGGCALAASGALVLVRLVARSFTGATVPVPSPTPGELAVCVVLAAIVALGRVSATAARSLASWLGLGGGLAVLLGLELHARHSGAPRGIVRVTFLDVGQGDAALVDLPDGSAMLVDGGGLVGSPLDVGERVVGELLSMRRRSALDVVVLTHPHPDHFLGLGAVVQRAPPRVFWDTGQGEAEGMGGAYASLLAGLRRRGTPVLHPGDLCGTRAVGGALVDVLAPCPDTAPDRGPNDNSWVIRVRYGDRAVLFAGDAERAEEGDLLRRQAAALRADVLKVGHHGSRTSSSPELVAAVSPAVAVISCGVRNRFGHPHAPTLDTLAQAGARVLRTDRAGSVVVTTDGHSLDVRTLAPE